MQNQSQELAPAIRRGRIDSITIYEISDSELNTLEFGSPDSIYLNFSIALISVCLSFLISLLTTTIDSIYIYIIFIVLIIICGIVGLILFVIWFKKRESTSDLINQIRNRVPPEGTQETTATAVNDP
jgi:hypothetical protein